MNTLNNTGSLPNYLNTEGTSREVISHQEATKVEGTLSEGIKNNGIVFKNNFYLGEETIIISDVVDVQIIFKEPQR